MDSTGPDRGASLLTQAKWIGFDHDSREDRFAERIAKYPDGQVPRRSFPSSMLRKEIEVAKPVESATLYVCGLGLHETYLNGERVGNHVLSPAQTTYDARAFYVVHDVTDSIHEGLNAIGLMLGNGFYGQNFAYEGALAWGAPRGKALLLLVYKDGTREEIASATSWRGRQSPVVFDNIYSGETYDARLEAPGWSVPGFDDADWLPATPMQTPTDTLLKEELEPIRKIRSIRPIAILPAENGDWIVDMGQNLTGWLQVKVREPRGNVVKLRFAELLMPDRQSVDCGSYGDGVAAGHQIDMYVSAGSGEECCSPGSLITASATSRLADSRPSLR